MSNGDEGAITRTCDPGARARGRTKEVAVEEWGVEIMRWLEQGEGPLAYVVLGLASLVEYVFPPFPGDTVALFGVFLAATAGWSALWVYLALNVGAMAGGMAAYGVGRAIAREDRRPRFLRGPRIDASIATITERYAKHGAAYLVINRFVPTLRAFFFVGAGIAHLPWPAVLLWGGLSAAAWNAILLGLGWSVGTEWERLRSILGTYSTVVLAIVVIAMALFALRAWARRRRAESAPR